jgi:two-component system cell cycle sensor histidine kinase/response regulator CckA
MLRQAVDTSGEIIFMTDPEGVFTFVNREFERFYGYASADVVGSRTPSILKGGLRSPDQYNDFWRRIRAGETVRDEFVNRTRDGKLVNVEISASPIVDNGQIVGFLAVQRDVTARKTLENCLRKSEVRYRTLADAAQDAIFIISRDGRFDYQNLAAAQRFNCQPKEIIGRSFRECFPPEVAEQVDAEVRQVAETGIPLYSEQLMQFPQGESWQSAWLVPIFDEQQNVTGVMGIARDITERRHLAEMLERQNSLLAAVIETSPIGIAVLDGVSLACSIANPALQRLIPDLMSGRRLPEVWPGDPPSLTRMLERVVSTGLPEVSVDVPLDGVSSDGSGRTFVTVTTSPLRLPGSATVGVLVQVADTSGRKQLEAEFYQAQKMEAVGRLAGGVAHDFNNLLTAILGYCELTLDTLEPADPRRADLEEIRHAGNSATTLTRQLLTFSRRQTVAPVIIDVNANVTAFKKIIDRTIGEDIALRFTLEPALARVTIDPGQLEQVLMNLCVNARDAMPRGGTLTIETRNAEIKNHEVIRRRRVPPGQYVELMISDTGSGMSADVQSHLFEPFFTTKEAGKGTGLGLPTVFGIVKQHNGYIDVVSEAGCGTTFTIYFPQVEQPATADDGSEPDDSLPLGSETVLIAEDNDAVRALAARTLDRCGYRTLVARNAEEALAMATGFSGPIHLLLTDVVMPVTDGVQFSQDLKRLRAETKVVFMSGYADDSVSRRELLEQGAFLQKPFARLSLARKVREALNATNANPALIV